MKVLMTGGTGFLGTALRSRLIADGHDITCLTRDREGAEGSTTYIRMANLDRLGPHDAVVNLAGESVVGLWTPAKKRRICESRVETTQRISNWIASIEPKPSVFLSGSAVGIYGDTGVDEVDEHENISTVEGFLADVCRDWERVAHGSRTVNLRTGQVYDQSGGALGTMISALRKAPVMVLGDRDAYISWIALDDWVGLAMFAITNESIVGPLNLTAPVQTTHGEVTDLIAKKLGKRVWGRIPKWALKLAGGFGDSLAMSQRVHPSVALDSGYSFKYPTIQDYPGLK